MTDQGSPRQAGIRQGLKLLLIAGCLTPLIFLFEGLWPSRENTIYDELPQIALNVSLLGMALAGVARITYSLLMERHRPTLGTPEGQHLPGSRNIDAPVLPAPKPEQRLRERHSLHNTPV